MIRCGFNHYEPSIGLKQENGIATAYISEPYPSTGAKNIVIIERVKGSEIKWYFGYFEGKAMSDRETNDESREYLDQVQQILDDDHQVMPDELERKLAELVHPEYDNNS